MITMDWMPTLLAAAGTLPDAAYPSDGEDLGPIMTGRAAPHPRKFYWRYKAGSHVLSATATGNTSRPIATASSTRRRRRLRVAPPRSDFSLEDLT
jgi:hypothetical protein